MICKHMCWNGERHWHWLTVISHHGSEGSNAFHKIRDAVNVSEG